MLNVKTVSEETTEDCVEGHGLATYGIVREFVRID